MASNSPTETGRAYNRQVELVVYDPGTVSSAAVLEQGGQEFGLLVSGLDIEFEVTRSQVYTDNTAEFKIYNASEQTRRQLAAPGQRVRFSAGYKDQGGPVGVFWGSILRAPSSRTSDGWVTVLTCVSSLTESLGSEDIATWDQKHPKASIEQKLAVVTRATNRVPVALSYGAGARVHEILRTLSTITGLVLWGMEGMPDITLPNGFVYVGGARGALDQLIKFLRRYGWSLSVDNTSLLVLPLEGGNLTASSAYLTYGTGLIEVKETTDMNIPPKLNKAGQRIIIPKSYEFECLLSPKVGPNSLVSFNVPQVKTDALVHSCTHSGDTFGGKFTTKGRCVVWSGPGDTYRKAP